MNSYLFGGGQRYQVIRHGVSVKRLDGRFVDVARGALVPTDANPNHIEHLLANKLIEPVSTKEK
ncbi:hypothetical protein [Agromyces indicus]|uniref:Uncharacterized protein n=1 Tax=Agromyces indicus TaxID=758919 RepID=A0ABU1FJJ9_9MICO|nr:hypothetical protein [Agromyces indicus]MDR5691909.1 hypothetical protein [Agromyces indicus]